MRTLIVILASVVVFGGLAGCASHGGAWPVRTVQDLEGAPLHEMLRSLGPPDQLFETSGDLARSRRPGEQMTPWRTDGFMLVYLEPRLVAHTDRHGRVARVEHMDERQFTFWQASVRERKAAGGP